MRERGDGWRTLWGLTRIGWPRRYPVVQFPNLPLVAGLAGLAGTWILDGKAEHYASALATVGLAGWAWWEAVRGDNAFRHALGVAALVFLVIRLGERLGS